MFGINFHDALNSAAGLILQAIAAAAVVVIGAGAALLKGKVDRLNEKVTNNVTRLASLENGGGDAKVDTRLSQHGLPLVEGLPSTQLIPGTERVEIMDSSTAATRPTTNPPAPATAP